MTKFIVSAILLILASTVQAEVYFELGIEGGGVPIVTTDMGDINPGGGFKIGMGVQNEGGENVNKLSIALDIYLMELAKPASGMNRLRMNLAPRNT